MAATLEARWVVALLDWLALGEAFLFSAISFSAVPSDDTLATRWVSLGDLVIGLPKGHVFPCSTTSILQQSAKCCGAQR
jgi:hypothetical protein